MLLLPSLSHRFKAYSPSSIKTTSILVLRIAKQQPRVSSYDSTFPSHDLVKEPKEMSNRTKRIMREMEDLHKDTASGMSAELIQNDLSHLRGKFKGPPQTPYEGGEYIVDIKIPNEYPFRPPQMRFETKVYHPNVSSQTVCS